MALEQVLSASKSALISSLDFSGPPPIASYIQKRSQVQIFPAGSASYSPSVGTKLMRFNVSTQSAFLDMQSLALKATVTAGAGGFTPTGPNLGTLIQEMRVYLGSVEVERISAYNRVEGMLHRFVSTDKRVQFSAEGFGYAGGGQSGSGWTWDGLAAGASETLVYRFASGPSGLCSQRCFLPAAFIGSGCVVELLLVNTAPEVAIEANADFTLTDCRLLVDAVDVDPGFSTALSKFLLGGGSLQLPLKQYSSVFYSVTGPSQQVVNARSYTRANSVFITFDDTTRHVLADGKRTCNFFPLLAPNEGVQLQCQIGVRVWPDRKQEGLSEQYHRLLNCIGIAGAGSSCNILKSSYKDDSWIGAFDLESVPNQAHASGQSTHNAPMVIDISGLAAAQADRPTGIWVTTWHESLITIEQDGVTYAM